jgi:hypothetical protein
MRIPLDGGGAIMVRAIAVDASKDRAGPVRAGRRAERVRDSVVEISQTMQEILAPVTAMSHSILEQFRRSGPDSVEVEFGVELSAEAGAVLASASGSCHLQVTLTWAAEQGPA